MSEHQMFDLLAQDAPVAGAGLADDVIDRARQHRRRRWAITACGTAVALIAVTPFMLAGGPAHSSRHTAVPGASTGGTTKSPAASTEARIFAAAMRHLPNPGIRGKPWRSIAIIDHTCTNVTSAFVGPCNARPIPADVQRDVLAALPRNPQVRFLSEYKVPAPGSGRSDSAVVSFGPIRITGHRATLPVAVQCGFDCLQGETLVLTERGGVWTVTGATGPGFTA